VAFGVVATLGLAPVGDALAKRHGNKAQVIKRVRWPASLQTPSVTTWVRAFLWELVDLKGWSSFFVHTSSIGQSVGKPYSGALVAAVELPEHAAYHRRHPKRVYATTSTVHHLQASIERVRELYPHLHRLSVGDLSAHHGGKLGGHRSHQSGRDVDLGFYFRERPWVYPFKFAQPTARNLHFRATWALIKTLADTSEAADGVDYILLDYDVQRLLYIWVMQQEELRDDVDRILQYPRGRTQEVGIVRHYPKHVNHLHVRFKCPPQDLLCV
jgi:murein endopeptidase